MSEEEDNPTTPKTIPPPLRKMPFSRHTAHHSYQSSSSSTSPLSPRRVERLRRSNPCSPRRLSSSCSPKSNGYYLRPPVVSPPSTPDLRRIVLRDTSGRDVLTSPQRSVDSNTLLIWKEEVLPIIRRSQKHVDSIEFSKRIIPHAAALLRRFAKTYSPAALSSSPICPIVCSHNSAHKPLHSTCSECQGEFDTMCSFCIDSERKDFRRVARRLHMFRKIWFYDLEKWLRTFEKPCSRDVVFELDVRREMAFEARRDLIRKSMDSSSSSCTFTRVAEDEMRMVSPIKS